MNRVKRTHPGPLKISLGLFIVAAFLLAGCDARKAQTRKRIDAVEKGLMRAVYLKGLKPGKMPLAERMPFYKVPGVSIAAIDRNKIEWVRAYGVQDILTRRPVAEDTLFQAGAFSQMIAAAAALQWAEKGKLDLQSDLGPQLRSWRLPPAESGAHIKITPFALLTHSSGLSDQVFAGYAQGAPLPTLVQILDGEKPANNGPVWVPGRRSSVSKTRYSEPGFVILEQWLADLTGKPFPAYVKATIFEPLGLTHSTFALPLSGEDRSRAASGHLREGQPVQGLWNNYPEAAAKGLWTTPSDFANFLADLLQSATDEGGKILAPAAARRMLSSQVEGYGFGFTVDGRDDDIHFSLLGRTNGYACSMTVYPAKGQAAVIMTNSDNGFVLIREIMCALAEAYDWPQYMPEEKPVLRLDPATYGLYTGRYEVRPDYVLDVTAEDYYLVIRPTDQAPTKFYAEGQTLFYATDPYIRIQFMKNPQGLVDSLVLWQQDFELEAKKIR